MAMQATCQITKITFNLETKRNLKITHLTLPHCTALNEYIYRRHCLFIHLYLCYRETYLATTNHEVLSY